MTKDKPKKIKPRRATPMPVGKSVGKMRDDAVFKKIKTEIEAENAKKKRGWKRVGKHKKATMPSGGSKRKRTGI